MMMSWCEEAASVNRAGHEEVDRIRLIDALRGFRWRGS